MARVMVLRDMLSRVGTGFRRPKVPVTGGHGASCGVTHGWRLAQRSPARSVRPKLREPRLELAGAVRVFADPGRAVDIVLTPVREKVIVGKTHVPWLESVAHGVADTRPIGRVQKLREPPGGRDTHRGHDVGQPV